MADSSSCSHWWHAPFYISLSLILAFISISTTTNHHSRPDNTATQGLALNASRALRTHGGFNTIATLLHISPGLFFSGNPKSTIFAIQDSSFSNLSIPPYEMKELLNYHTTPCTLSKTELFKKPTGFCFKTLLQDKNFAITEKDAKTGSIMINSVLVSHPNLFVQGPIAVHGIVKPFEMISCDFLNKTSSSVLEMIEWTRVVRFLSSNGYVSFAVGLNAVLDGINFQNLGSCTIFVPPNSGFTSSPSPFLERIVRIHIVPRRFTYMELVAAEESSLRTLVPGCDLKIDRFGQNLVINGVEIIAPDIFSSDKFVVHGISRDFDADDHFSSVR
ncbi:hypothetical protein ACJIZ3_022294 [Penstemon smallii]|uniref:FAS1 domain-containing protein n=1 Tax=Penstemon smallii TaxID=265156 RepID=A0ABD3TN02_9LAMI